jgi:hypothetical protein
LTLFYRAMPPVRGRSVKVVELRPGSLGEVADGFDELAAARGGRH